ncbi:MAG: hypothetical protein HYZ53_12705 [Planctomycetes bacterium]|nr:hypothetical protein [Planctomycetota bacterium]
MASIDQIAQRLTDLRGAVRRLYLQHGVASLVLWASGFVAATFVVDFGIPNVPRAVRLLFLVLGLAGLGFAYLRYIRYPQRAALSDDDIAGRLEAQFPGLRDRLISTVQLLRMKNDRFSSPDMVKALAVETVRASRDLDFASILLPSVPRRLTYLAATGVVCLLVSGLCWSTYAGIYINRLFGGSMKWPQKTILLVELPTVVAKGDDVRISVTASQGFPSKAYLRCRFASGVEEQHRMTRLADRQEFRHEFPKVTEGFSVSVQGGDDETPWREIQVLIPPRVERVQAFFSYPRYTGLADTPKEKPEEGGNLRVPIGTRASLRISVNIPIESGRLLLGRAGQAQEAVTLAVTPDASGAPRLLLGAVNVERDSEYTLEAKATNGLKNKEPVRYTIKALVDNAPTVKVLEPGVDKYVTPAAVVPIRAAVTDDYGIRRISLVHKFVAGEKPPEVTIQFDPTNNSAEYGTRKIDSTYEFDLTSIKAKEGDVISYRVEAEDTNEAPQANVTRSRQFLFTVISKDALSTQLDEQRMRVKEDLQKLAAYPEEERRGVLRLQELLGTKDTLERAERQSIASAATSQRQVSQRLERLAHALDEILKDVEQNRLWDVTSREKLSSMRDTLKGDSETKSPEVTNQLTQAANASKAPERMSRLGESGEKQKEILEDLRQVLGKMGEWEDYMEVVKIVRGLKEKQNRLNKRIPSPEGGH